jgi:hypothetical protein
MAARIERSRMREEPARKRPLLRLSDIHFIKTIKTNSIEPSPIEKLIVAPLANKFPACYGAELAKSIP